MEMSEQFILLCGGARTIQLKFARRVISDCLRNAFYCMEISFKSCVACTFHTCLFGTCRARDSRYCIGGVPALCAVRVRSLKLLLKPMSTVKLRLPGRLLVDGLQKLGAVSLIRWRGFPMLRKRKYYGYGLTLFLQTWFSWSSCFKRSSRSFWMSCILSAKISRFLIFDSGNLECVIL